MEVKSKKAKVKIKKGRRVLAASRRCAKEPLRREGDESISRLARFKSARKSDAV